MTDRDTFAAAALPLCTRNFRTAEQIAESAYKLADAMLRERSRAGQKMAESDSFCAACPERESTNHDAAPAARAEECLKEPTGHATGEPGGYPEGAIGTGNTSATTDTAQPRNGALSGCETVPDPDSRVWETLCTPQPHATPTQGSVQGEGSFRDSQNAKEPVAWHINGSECDTGCEYEYATLERGIAEAATAEGCVVVPLYRHPQPTLTRDERDAVEWVSQVFAGEFRVHGHSLYKDTAATLRKLLERLA